VVLMMRWCIAKIRADKQAGWRVRVQALTTHA
jgi:hypothetical protein